MLWARAKSSLRAVLFGAFILVLLLAGGLLYRWISRASDADRQQRREFLQTAMQSFRGEFVGAIQEIFVAFRPAPRLAPNQEVEPFVAGLLAEWQGLTSRPQLVNTVSVAFIAPDGEIAFRRLQAGRFEAEAWPVSLELLRNLLDQRRHSQEPQPPFPPGAFPFALSEDRPIIVIPIIKESPLRPGAPVGVGPPAGFGPGRGPRLFAPGRFPMRPNQGTPRGQLIGWCFLELDVDYLSNQFLPALAVRHFGPTGLLSYKVAVVTGDGQRILYKSDSSLTPEAIASADAAMPLFIPRPPGGPGGFGPGGPGPDQAPAGPPFGPGAESVPNPPNGPAAFVSMRSDVWQLVAQHQSGSIAAVVSAARLRNLVIGFGILFLLGSSIVVLLIAAERARALAKRQMEFVAGVSHELRTPLSVIQSAGFNLARGLVEDSSRVRQYGTTIQTEGRRLSDMIEQILSYAGIQSGRKQYDLRPIQISDVVDRALAEYAPAFNEAGWQVEKEIEENLPPVLADAPSLESAVKNLLHNALKYASTGKWLRVSARATPGTKNRELQITVEDRGPGIDPADLPHLFEPFYRGRKNLASAVPGAGLGLSLLKRHLQAHRGRVTVKSSPGQGAAFTLNLPAFTDGDH